jgi:hypothetical protein
VEKVLKLYEDHSHAMFSRATLLSRVMRNEYEKEEITRFFKSHFKDKDGTLSRLGTARLGVGEALKYLMIIMRNATTGSPWPVTNNPKAKYNRLTHPECNLGIELWQLLRASTAAPTYFPPEEILLGKKMRICVDGGLTPYNNPAFIAVLTATLPEYKIEWELGVDKLHVVSIGTGADRAELPPKKARNLNKLDFARYVAPALIDSAAVEQDLICRLLGDCLAGDAIDREVYDLRGQGPGLLRAGEKKFTYVRYNTRLRTRLDELGGGIAASAFDLDNLELIPLLKERGAAFAKRAVKREHLFSPFAKDPRDLPRSEFETPP